MQDETTHKQVPPEHRLQSHNRDRPLKMPDLVNTHLDLP